jgi:hypothetical protein
MTIIESASVRGMEDHPTGIAVLDERIPFLLSQLGSHVAGEFQRRMSGIGVQPRTHGVLMALATEDCQSQRQFSARLGIHRNATTATKVLGFAKVAKFCGGISPSMAAAAAATASRDLFERAPSMVFRPWGRQQL